VETQGQADFLRANGCDRVQGFLYGKPLPAAAATELMQG
jgi:EAL domain-containing protein (putative c-di-GMP-specific phosphodiesterase class I)